MPWDVAWALDHHELKGFSVVFGEYKSGQTYDWAANEWVKGD